MRQPYLLVGHSIGGVYIRRFDKLHDAQVAGMVLVDSAHEEQLWRFAKSEPGALGEYPHWTNNDAISAEGFLPPVWHEMQQDLASRSPQGKLITATESTHYIHKQQVELVAESIRSILLQSRDKPASP